MTDALRKAAQAVLDRWDSPQWEWSTQGPTADLMQALRAALAQPAASGEPVAWQERQEMRPGEFGEWYERSTGWSMRRPAEIESSGIRYQFRPLYTAPQPVPALVPLTEAQIWEIGNTTLGQQGGWNVTFARAIEAAHGIAAKEAP